MSHLTTRLTTNDPAMKQTLLAAKLPRKTDSYSPVSHKQVIEMTMGTLDKLGLKVVDERYLSACDGRQALGLYQIGGFGDKEMGMQIGWNNSYDKKMTLKWAIGGEVFVCGNGSVCGDIGAFKRKHTGSVLTEYGEIVKRYIGDADMHFSKLLRDKEFMKNITCSKRDSAELVGRMFLEEDIITATQLNVIKRELINPTFDYKADGTLWQLYNHCTVALKDAHPLHHMQQHTDVHKFFMNVSNN